MENKNSTSVIILCQCLLLTWLGLLNGIAQPQLPPRNPQGDLILVPDTDYPVPGSGAYFVSPAGNDANPGTQAQPWRTVGKAVNTASDGSTIVLRAGVYPVPYTDVYKRLTYQPYPHEQVWLTGSEVVTGWTQDGNAWRHDGWTVEFPIEGPPTTSSDRPIAGHRDQAFVNGRELEQVGSRAEVGPGKFYADYAANRLYLGDNPAGRTVEATVTTRGLGFFEGNPPTAAGSGSVLRGLGFCHYAQQALSMGSVRGFLFENNVFAANAFIGLEMYGERDYLTNNYAGQPGYATLRGNTFSYNGQQGLVIGRCHGLLFENNTVTHNNTEGFSLGWGAAGMKAYTAQNMIVRNNLFADNAAHGLWFDVGVNNSLVVNNLFRNNRGTGMFYEISKGGIFAGNVLLRNGEEGIRVLNHDNLKVYNNTSVGDYTACHVYDSGRQPEPGDLDLGANFVTRNVTVKNNIWADATITDGGQALFDTWWYDWWQAAGREPMLSALDYNAYVRSTSSQPTNVARIALPPSRLDLYQTLAQLQAGTTYEDHGYSLDGTPLTSLFVNPASGDYHLASNTSLRGTGEPLPSDVAQALGVAAGVPVDKGAYPAAGGSSTVTQLQDGTVYELEPQCAPGSRLDVRYAGSENGTIVRLWGANRSDAQRWKAISSGNGAFELEPQHALGKRLDVVDWGTGDTTHVQIWGDSNGANQRWKAVDAGNGYIELEPQHAPGKRLDVKHANSADGTTIWLYSDNNSPAQRWKLIQINNNGRQALTAELSRSVVALFPNPASGQVQLRITAEKAQKACIVLYNQQGQQLYDVQPPASTGENQFILPLKHLAAGLYMIRVMVDRQTYTHKLSVE